MEIERSQLPHCDNGGEFVLYVVDSDLSRFMLDSRLGTRIRSSSRLLPITSISNVHVSLGLLSISGENDSTSYDLLPQV